MHCYRMKGTGSITVNSKVDSGNIHIECVDGGATFDIKDLSLKTKSFVMGVGTVGTGRWDFISAKILNSGFWEDKILN